ncbi:hypothetical protein [Anoxybacillus sp. J5B_2022]|uniref:hypothetical protein n=1 Tax=Anoxybacillus sp. J5B_2022 TaxID=3003246 RepID=UPI00228574A5|nr:hypothetical protein [Anoxybacillus sp. J5B_2022]MCZ0755056.1 hypothetical protein [Anoxybacillus sp. J5B_2022]
MSSRQANRLPTTAEKLGIERDVNWFLMVNQHAEFTSSNPPTQGQALLGLSLRPNLCFHRR